MGHPTVQSRIRPVKPETQAIHIPDKLYDGAMAPPIHVATTFEHGPANELIHDFQYVRHAGPNINDLEDRLAALEGGVAAVAFASGIAAGSAMMNTVPRGSTIIFHDTIYFDFLTVAREYLEGWGLQAKIVNCRDEGALRDACGDTTALVWIETPTNPSLDILDIRAISEIAKQCGAKTLVDGTFATPVLQKPFDLGADFVLHSTTKYMGGHSDVLGGAIIVRDDADTAAELLRMRKLTGGAPAPFNAWLTSRGLQTLHCRVEKHSENAMAVASAIQGHAAIEQLRYPFLAAGKEGEIARAQMSAGGGMMSLDIKGGYDGAVRVAAALRLITNATSLGGVESLVEHRKSIEGPETTTPDGLLRFSIGLEHPDDLIADLLQALDFA
jgi:cystathionine gamma-synthase